MHYRDGTPAKNGDHIVQLSYEGGKILHVGVLHSANPGSDHCNGVIAPVQNAREGACLCDCLTVEKIAELLAAAGLDKRPAGK